MTTIKNLTQTSGLQSGDIFPIYSTNSGRDRGASLSDIVTYIKDNGTNDSVSQFTTQYATPNATGFTVAIEDGSSNIHLILSPTAGFATGTITLPSAVNAVDKQMVLVNTTQAIGALTIDANGATAVVGAPAMLGANDSFQLKYDATTKNWYSVAKDTTSVNIYTTFESEGAIGDGTTDDSSAINATLLSLSITGGVIKAKPGATYLIDAATASFYSNITIDADPSVTFLTTQTGEFSVFTFPAGVKNCGIRGFPLIKGAYTESTLVYDSGNNGVNTLGTLASPNTNITLDVEFTGFGDTGFFPKHLQDSTVDISAQFCGKAGFLGYSCLDVDVYSKSGIRDLFPGSPAVAPNGNVYGVEFTSAATGGVANEPGSKNCRALFIDVRNIYSWTGIGTHGGDNIQVIGCTAENCWIPFKADEGDQSGDEGSNPAAAFSVNLCRATKPTVAVAYDAETGAFTEGLVVTGGTSGATGTIVRVSDDGATGDLLLKDVTGHFVDNEAITDTSTGAATMNGDGLRGAAVAAFGSSSSALLQGVKVTESYFEGYGHRNSGGLVYASNVQDLYVAGNTFKDAARCAIGLKGTVTSGYIGRNYYEDVLDVDGARYFIISGDATVECHIEGGDFTNSGASITAVLETSGDDITYGGKFKYSGTITKVPNLVDEVLQFSGSVDFGSINAAGGIETDTITATGAETGDIVLVSVSSLASGSTANVMFQGYVSAADTVTIKATNNHATVARTLNGLTVNVVVMKA